ncbi:V-type ATPase subunit [Eubacteriales bacterium OttesenSCG-928-N13]|nr:V-type ATPase subunit [Eubacteriales bacterium OttesenSCG-928-N13]
MPQKSHGFAVGRVRVLEQGLMGRSGLDRLASANSLEEMARALTEFGWGEARTRADIEALCDNQLQQACKQVRDDTPEPDVTDCFLLKYDALNLKVLLKSRVLGLVPSELSQCGTIDPERLRRAVSENNYIDLPAPLKLAMEQIEKRIASSMDPLYVDAQLDKAIYQMIQDKLVGVKNDTIKHYFAARADLTNILIALRANQMGRGASFAKDLLVPGGSLSIEDVQRVADEPERAQNITFLTEYAPLIRDALAVPNRGEGIALLEKRADDLLLGLIRPHRYESQSVLPLVGYLLAREREAMAVRLIATAKSANVPRSKLDDRLRELYS